MNAALHITIGNQGGFSYLKQVYFTTPFKVANISQQKKQPTLHLMLMSSSPGILDGDSYDIKIEVENNCALHLHTQAYQRLFNMKNGASQQMLVSIADGASFVYLPHPSVPHEQSVFTSQSNFYLGKNCHFIFGEILTCGRKLNGEAFLFSKYHSINRFFIQNQLVIKENLLMQPLAINVQAIGQMEGYTHQASFIFLNEEAEIKQLQKAFIDVLATEKDIEYGVSAAPVNGLIVRLLGNGAQQLFTILHTLHHIIKLNNHTTQAQNQPGTITTLE